MERESSAAVWCGDSKFTGANGGGWCRSFWVRGLVKGGGLRHAQKKREFLASLQRGDFKITLKRVTAGWL